jgi:hypothetical protein
MGEPAPYGEPAGSGPHRSYPVTNASHHRPAARGPPGRTSLWVDAGIEVERGKAAGLVASVNVEDQGGADTMCIASGLPHPATRNRGLASPHAAGLPSSR